MNPLRARVLVPVIVLSTVVGCSGKGVCVYDTQVGNVKTVACAFYAKDAKSMCGEVKGKFFAAKDAQEAAEICTAQGHTLTK